MFCTFYRSKLWATRNPQPATRNPQPATRNPQPATKNYKQLLNQKHKLEAQLNELQFALYDSSAPETAAHINQLQVEQIRQQTLLDQASQQLQSVQAELKQFEEGPELPLLRAIAEQWWLRIQNLPQVLFHSRAGMLFLNFDHENVKPVTDEQFQATYANFTVHQIGKGKWQCLHNLLGDSDQFLASEKYPGYSFSFTYPSFGRGRSISRVTYSRYNKSRSFSYHCFDSFSKNDETDSLYNIAGYILPYYSIPGYPEEVHPHNPLLTDLEKAQLILDFMVQKGWIPVFEGEDAGRLTALYTNLLKRDQLQNELGQLNAQLGDFPAENHFTSQYEFRAELAFYDQAGIAASPWQYSRAAQQWLRGLLAHIDGWENQNSHLLAHAAALNRRLAATPKTGTRLNEDETAQLNQQLAFLQQRLDFGLQPLRARLSAYLTQAQALETALQNTQSLDGLAALAAQERPDFAVLAEHSATLCTQTLQKLEWLAENLEFVQQLADSEQQIRADYLVLLDKHQQDLAEAAAQSSIDAEHAEQWFAEWRKARFQMLAQWLPLVQAGLDGIIGKNTVLAMSAQMADYQTQTDRFYLNERLAHYTNTAFSANGHRQEKLLAEQSLAKLNHSFMAALQELVFGVETGAEKLWLLRFADVWQQGILNEIEAFLANESLIERDDIAQIIMQDMRQIREQNLAACLQDAQNYSDALAQREKDFGTLIFKMRKALEKA